MVPGAIDKSPTSFHGARRVHGVEIRSIVHQARCHGLRRGIKPIPCAPYVLPSALELSGRSCVIPDATVARPANSHRPRRIEAIQARTTLRNARGHYAGFRVEPIPIRAVEQPASLHCARYIEEAPAIIARNPAEPHGAIRNGSVVAGVQKVAPTCAFRKADSHDALVIEPIPKAPCIQPSFGWGRVLVVEPLVRSRVVFPTVFWMRRFGQCRGVGRRLDRGFTACTRRAPFRRIGRWSQLTCQNQNDGAHPNTSRGRHL